MSIGAGGVPTSTRRASLEGRVFRRLRRERRGRPARGRGDGRARGPGIRAGEVRDGYAYAERPLREELVEELEHAGERTAAITRNSYGSLVLNTEGGMFVDIDYPPRESFSALRRAFGRLFGRQVPTRDERIRTRVRDVVGSRRAWGSGCTARPTATVAWSPAAPTTRPRASPANCSSVSVATRSTFCCARRRSVFARA